MGALGWDDSLRQSERAARALPGTRRWIPTNLLQQCRPGTSSRPSDRWGMPTAPRSALTAIGGGRKGGAGAPLTQACAPAPVPERGESRAEDPLRAPVDIDPGGADVERADAHQYMRAVSRHPPGVPPVLGQGVRELPSPLASTGFGCLPGLRVVGLARRTPHWSTGCSSTTGPASRPGSRSRPPCSVARSPRRAPPRHFTPD